MIELKPCPFCGTRRIYRGDLSKVPSSITTRKHYRECMGCLVEIKGYDTEEEADAAWNKRAPQEAA